MAYEFFAILMAALSSHYFISLALLSCYKALNVCMLIIVKSNTKKGDYIVFGVPLPAQCAATLDDDDCILGLVIDIPASLLVELSQWRDDKAKNSPAPIFTVSQQSLDANITDATRRLLQALTHSNSAKALGAGFVREIVYYILNGPAGHVLCGLTDNGHYARIAQALRTIHDEYSSVLNVDSLAASANMSVSGFHRAFRDVVMDSPVQYIKKNLDYLKPGS